MPVAPTHRQNGFDPGAGKTCAHALQPLGDQNAIVEIQRHHIRHRAQGHQIEKSREIGLAPLLVEPSQLAQSCAQRCHHIKDYTHTRRRLAEKFAARLIGIDDGIGVRQHRTWQVVIGDQHRDLRVFPGHPHQRLGESGWLYLPAHLGARQGWPVHRLHAQIGQDEIRLRHRDAVADRAGLGCS